MDENPKRILENTTFRNMRKQSLLQIYYTFLQIIICPGVKRDLSTRIIYYCQRDGRSAPHCTTQERQTSETPGRKSQRKNKKGRIKTDHVCPAKVVSKVKSLWTHDHFTGHIFPDVKVIYQLIDKGMVGYTRISISVP